MATLYEITDEYRTLLDLADSIEPEDEKLFLDTLESINGELEVKAAGYAAVITELDAMVDVFDTEIKRLSARKEAMRNNVKRMKAALKEAMELTGQNEIKTKVFKLKICKNGGKQPMEITGTVPENYMKVIYEQDSDKIRADLEAGKELDFAVLKDRGTHLRIS